MDGYPLNHLLGLPYAVLQHIVWHLCAPAAGALANCIRDPTLRATVQSAPARVSDLFWFKRACWQLPSPRWIVPGGRSASTIVTGEDQFRLFWQQLNSDDFAAAVAEGVAPWLELSVYNCDAIGDEHLELLGRICRGLHLDRCRGVSRVGLLGHVPRLELSGCGRVTDLTGLGAQGQVSVHLWALKITSLQPVGRVAVISVSDCPLVLDLEGLGGPEQVNVTLRALKITSLGPVGRVAVLYVSDCPSLLSLKGIDTPGSLILSKLPIMGLLGLTGVKAAVDVISCPNVRSAEGLQGCKSVNLLQLQQLCDVGMLGAVPHVSITSCPKVLELWHSEPGQYVELTDMAQVKNLDTLTLAASIKID
ncbi:MAG: hypothetical protein EBT98_06385 [Opitutaceae bacterium]|nr:hypothetical protein [Opitutaceae bacterium]